MNKFVFSKIHGAGNDFIITDETQHKILCNQEFIRHVCDRRRGIGADGFIVLANSDKTDLEIPCFKMTFYNCDGSSAGMCGNGLRSAAYYACKYLNPKSRKILFETETGVLKTNILQENLIQIQIPLLSSPERIDIDNKELYKVNTGVPHLIVPVEDVAKINIKETGSYLRNHQLFQPEGTNVDFISVSEKGKPVMIRTFERGVEGETCACGTGITAAALSLAKFKNYKSPVKFLTRDKDKISIDFCYNENIVDSFKDILLTGPVEEVFKGQYRQ